MYRYRCSFAIHSFVQNLSQIGQEMAVEFDKTHTHEKKFAFIICIDILRGQRNGKQPDNFSFT